jgi:S-adenosylhomocysteine hydrolase
MRDGPVANGDRQGRAADVPGRLIAHLFDNFYGTGQSTLQALLRLTNRQIAGTRLVVVGYGFVGRASPGMPAHWAPAPT